MDRRGFIGTLLAAIGVTAIDPKALLWRPSPEAIEIIEPSAILTLNQMTFRMLKEIVNTLGVSVASDFAGDKKIGQRIHGVELNHQYNVGMEMLPETVDRYGLDHERYIKPAAASLVKRLNGVKGCGALPIPSGVIRGCVAHDPRSGFALRGLMQYQMKYDYTEEIPIFRFDMLVAQ